MASSGSFNTTAYSVRYLTFTWSIKSQDVATNSTVISWTLKGAGSASTWYKSGPFKVVIGGVTVYSSDQRIELAPGTLVKSGTHTIVHNADGTRSFTASVEAAIYSTAVNVSGSGTFTLDMIPRASQPSLVTWPETTNDVGEFGQEFSIHMNRSHSSLTHTVRYEYGKRSGTIATGVTTGTTWTVPLDFMNDIPNATSASGRIYVDTYSGNVKVGTKYTGFTVKVPDSVRPTCTATLTDVSGVGDIYGYPVQGLSRIKIVVNPTLAYGSPIVSYTVTANGATYTTKESTTDVLKKSGGSAVTVTVTDKRGRTGSWSYSMSVRGYTAPSITKLTVHRCNEDGTENEQGEHVKVLFSAQITALDSKNIAVYTLRYKKSDETTYTEERFVDLGFAVVDQPYIFPADSNASYDVEVAAQDMHGTTTRSTSASTAFTLMNWGADGTSMGIGKVAEKANTLQIGLDVEFLGKISGAIFDAIYPVDSIYISYNHTNPRTLFGGYWVRINNAFLWGTTSTGTIGQKGGESEVTLTTEQIPAHNHGGTYTNAGSSRTHAWLASNGSAMGYDSVSVGGGQAHNNMPPYVQVSIWRRVE